MTDQTKHITALAAAAAALQNANMPALATIIPEGYKLASLAPFHPTPAHFKADFITNSLPSYCVYLNDTATADSKIYIDQGTMKALAIIDQGQENAPRWGKHRAALTLNPTPAYKALLIAYSSQFTQREFIEWIQDWRENLVFYVEDSSGEDGDKLSFNQALAAFRNLKAVNTTQKEQTDQPHAASASLLASIEYSAGSGNYLPTHFTFTAIPYEGLEAVTLICAITAAQNDKGITLKYRIVGLETQQEAIAQNFADAIKERFNPENELINKYMVRIYTGTISYQ